MKKFRFSLQTVHDLRERVRDEAERELARATAAVRAAHAQLEEFAKQREQMLDAYAAKLHHATTQHAGKFDAHEAIWQTDYLRQLIDREIEQQARLASLESEADAKRAIVVRTAREAEATTNLHEQHYTRYQAEVARHEQSTLDEMATLIVARRHKGN